MTVAELIAALQALHGDPDLMPVRIPCFEHDGITVDAVVRVDHMVELRATSALAAVTIVEVTEDGKRVRHAKPVVH